MKVTFHVISEAAPLRVNLTWACMQETSDLAGLTGIQHDSLSMIANLSCSITLITLLVILQTTEHDSLAMITDPSVLLNYINYFLL